MRQVFYGDFSAQTDGVYPQGWMLERHADLFHDLAEIRAGALRILFPGNLHLPIIPPLYTGQLALTLRSDQYSANCKLLIFFRYSSRERSGYCIAHSWGTDGLKTAFGICRKGIFQTLTQVEGNDQGTSVVVAEPCRLRLEIGAREFAFYHGEKLVALFRDPQNAFENAGMIAFDRGTAGNFYVLDILHLQIESEETEKFTSLWPERSFALPPDLNGITDPWRFQIVAQKSSYRTRLAVTLDGGPTHRAPSVCDFRRERANARLIRPYLRIESGIAQSASQKHYLHAGAMGLKEHWNPRSSGELPADTEGPVSRELWFDKIPEDAWLALGYEYYVAEDRLALAGGPSEMIVCPRTGNVLYEGAALDHNSLIVEVLSPADKKIVGLIPQDEVRRDAAINFAKNNHFFFEAEEVSFVIQVRHRRVDLRNQDLSCRVILEDAFQTAIDNGQTVALSPALSNTAEMLRNKMGVFTLSSAAFRFTGLKVGVYHLHVELVRGAQTLLSVRRAFEVMADDPAALPPPLASGLPDLLPQIPDYATETGAFDPWVGRAVDAMHYLANCSHHILSARQNKIWDVIHLYRRRWAVELHQRMTPDRDPESNADVICHADRIYWNQRHDLWHGNYDKVVLDALLKFLRKNPIQVGQKSCLDVEQIERSGQLAPEMYAELLTVHWKTWVEFFNQYMLQEHLPAMHRRLRSINSKAEWMTYGIYPPYGSTYKGAYFCRYTGRDLRNSLERFYDGPMLWEDYPYMCGYPLQRAVFMLMAVKLEAPALKIYPEVYGVNGCASDGRVVYGVPPYGHSHTPPAFFRKTFFEYAFATAWLAQDGWHYWQDDGFNAMAWTQAHYQAMITTWRIIRNHRPAKPLRTTAFALSQTVCQNHPDLFFETRINSDFEPPRDYHDVVNTAEEDTAFAYEEARLDGQLAGFVVDLKTVAQIDPADTCVLVLPPLVRVSPEIQASIRRLHEHGVGLIGFEESGELADLFGVQRRSSPVKINLVRTAAKISNKPWQMLPNLQETCETPYCIACYHAINPDVEVVVEGMASDNSSNCEIVPAVICRQTKWGRTVFFNLPPTMVKRQDLKWLVSYGKENRSLLMKRAMALALRWAGRPAVETTAGKIIAFFDQHGQVNIVVMEDNHPAPATPIWPVLTIWGTDLDPEMLEGDTEWRLIEKTSEFLRIGLQLPPHGSAHLYFRRSKHVR